MFGTSRLAFLTKKKQKCVFYLPGKKTSTTKWQRTINKQMAKHPWSVLSTESSNSPHLTLFDELKLFDYVANEYLHRTSTQNTAKCLIYRVLWNTANVSPQNRRHTTQCKTTKMCSSHTGIISTCRPLSNASHPS